MSDKLKIGISSCLLGEQVRFDGGHKRDRFLTDVLAEYVEWVPTCPEAAIGMGIPRESVHLEGDPDAPLMIGNKTRTDWTNKMNLFTQKRSKELSKESICGYIFKKNSPSCGLYGVPLKKDADRTSHLKTSGLFAGKIKTDHPILPIEDEGRLKDARIRENFIIRIFSYHRLQQALFQKFSNGKLVQFHSENKYLILSHSPKHYKELGKLVADCKNHKPSEILPLYTAKFMEALSFKTTPKKNTNVLQHMLGYLKKDLDTKDKQNILESINDYYNKLVPLVVPITLLRHYVLKFNVEYLKMQTYLNPHPKELLLRNHV